MSQITIEGELFEDNYVPSNIAVGAPMTEGHVASLLQTRRENLRNNFSKRVKQAKENGGVTNETHADFAEYATSYEFGVRQPGTPRVTRDPVEREAFKIIRSVISAAYQAKYKTTIDKDVLATKADQLFEAKADEYMKRARASLKAKTVDAVEIDV